MPVASLLGAPVRAQASFDRETRSAARRCTGTFLVDVLALLCASLAQAVALGSSVARFRISS